MLLKEVRVLTDLQVISESRETGVMCIRGTFQRAEEANHNQRIYPKAVLENCVKSLGEKLKGRELVGELDHPADGVVKLQNASHLITKLEWQGNDLIGEAEILPTPAGQIAKSLINAGVKIGISSRGMGTLSESVKGPKIVNDDYKMITFDLVADPSTKGAYPSLAESRQHAIDFVENVIKPAISEKAFVARLKKALNENKVTEEQETLGNETLTPRKRRALKRHHEETHNVDDETLNAMANKHEKKKVEEMCGPRHKKKNKLKEGKILLRRMVNELYSGTLPKQQAQSSMRAGAGKTGATRVQGPETKPRITLSPVRGTRVGGPGGIQQPTPDTAIASRTQSSRGVNLGGSNPAPRAPQTRFRPAKTLGNPLPRIQNSFVGRAYRAGRKFLGGIASGAKNLDNMAARSRIPAGSEVIPGRGKRFRTSLANLIAPAETPPPRQDASVTPLTLPNLMEMEASRSPGPGETEQAKKSLDKQTADFFNAKKISRQLRTLGPGAGVLRTPRGRGNVPVTKTSWVRKQERHEGQLG